MWRKDSQSRILVLAFRLNGLNRFKLFPLRSEAAVSTRRRRTGVPRPYENAHPPGTPLGPWAWAYGRVLGGCVFSYMKYPCMLTAYYRDLYRKCCQNGRPTEAASEQNLHTPPPVEKVTLTGIAVANRVDTTHVLSTRPPYRGCLRAEPTHQPPPHLQGLLEFKDTHAPRVVLSS